MKILRRGNPEVAKWWLHVPVTCKTCQSELQLESDDQVRPWSGARHEPESVSFPCPVCGKTVVQVRLP